MGLRRPAFNAPAAALFGSLSRGGRLDEIVDAEVLFACILEDGEVLAAPYSLTPSVTVSLPIVGSAKSPCLLGFEIQIDPHAPTTQNFRISLPRHHIEPGFAATFRAPELCEQALERFDDSTEFLLAEARPLVVVDRLVDHPLLAAVVL